MWHTERRSDQLSWARCVSYEWWVRTEMSSSNLHAFSDAGSSIAVWGLGEPIWFGQSSCYFWLVQPWQHCFPPLRTKDDSMSWECYAGHHPKRRIPHMLPTLTAQTRRRNSPSSSKLTIARTFCSNSWIITRRCLTFSRLSSSGTMLESRHPKSYGTAWGLIQCPWPSRSSLPIECATDSNRSQRLILMVCRSVSLNVVHTLKLSLLKLSI